MIETSFLKHLDRLSLIISKKVTSNYVGERESKYGGRGLVFKDYHIYTPGDDFRAIDWKVFARTDKLFVRQYEEERNLTVHIIIDGSASMHFGRGTTKADYAGMLGVGFAYMAMKNNERFVLATFAEKLELFKPQKGKKQLISMIDYLNKRKPQGKSKLESALLFYKKLLTSKSLVVVVSDFLYPTEEIGRVLSRLKHHEVVLIQVLDAMEAKLNLEGDFKLQDAETNQQMNAFISPLLRKNYFAQLAEHQAKIKKACDSTGAGFYTFSTDTPIFDAFYKVLS